MKYPRTLRCYIWLHTRAEESYRVLVATEEADLSKVGVTVWTLLMK